jgi:methyltransferase (TIGR00027 family)
MQTNMQTSPPFVDLQQSSWEEHYRTFINPELVTALIHEAVPATRYVGFAVTNTAEGYAEGVLPLNEASTNQHGTHQAALMALAADYTAGVAIGSVLRGVPTLGLHAQKTNNGAAIWLIRAQLEYKAPSVADLVITATVSAETAERVRSLYATGAAVVEDVQLSMVAGGELVATATFTYMLRQSRHLKPQSASARPGTLFKHRVKTSARLIAGLRAEAGAAGMADPDPFSAEAAGTHGHFLARRFTRVLPQLPAAIAARTRHVDEHLVRALAQGVRQVVLVGAGFDFRCLRLAHGGRLRADGAVRTFELDLPHMLDERSRILSRFPADARLERVPLEVNLELQDLSDVLRAGGYDPVAPAFIVFEGTSMYLDREANRRVLTALASLAAHPASRVWIDVVSQATIDRRTDIPEVDAFLSGMEQLGEPFVFGIDDAAGFFSQCNLEVREEVPSSVYQPAPADPVFSLYRFCLLAALR